jgi:hypothetical protein
MSYLKICPLLFKIKSPWTQVFNTIISQDPDLFYTIDLHLNQTMLDIYENSDVKGYKFSSPGTPLEITHTMKEFETYSNLYEYLRIKKSPLLENETRLWYRNCYKSYTSSQQLAQLIHRPKWSIEAWKKMKGGAKLIITSDFIAVVPNKIKDLPTFKNFIQEPLRSYPEYTHLPKNLTGHAFPFFEIQRKHFAHSRIKFVSQTNTKLKNLFSIINQTKQIVKIEPCITVNN